jgi:hypothetical protein
MSIFVSIVDPKLFFGSGFGSCFPSSCPLADQNSWLKCGVKCEELIIWTGEMIQISKSICPEFLCPEQSETKKNAPCQL